GIMKIPISKLLNNTGQIEGVPTNPRTIDKADYQKLLKSIQEDPEYLDHEKPHVIAHGDKYVVLNGNQRLRALRELKFTETPVTIYKPDTPPEVIRARIIKSNHGYGKDDLDMLANDVWSDDPLCEWGMDLPDDWLQDEQEVIEDEAPEVDESEPPKSKLGKVYQLGRHRVMCGDSTSLTDAGLLMNGERAGMLFTDPPYGVSYQSNKRVKTSKFEVIDNDDVILDFMPIVKEYCDGFVYVCTTWRVLDVWTELFGGYYKITNMVIWDKGGGGMGDLLKTYVTDYEIILVSNNDREIVGKRYGSIWELNKKDVTKMNKKELLDIALDVKKSTSLWKQNKDAASTYVHPTQKPVSLSARAIQSSVEQGDIVLDLFLGSGSTLIACEQTNRICYGMELDPKYVDVIRKRYW
ncbi:DNA modification methylase, partial [Acinetobacter sp.]|uniref:DNA modification methylase n=1 Tax=Acinetobacter sp. TaxID=472 RepID=UPI0025B8A770